MCIVNTVQPQPTVPCRRTVCQPHVCGHYQRLFVSAVVPPPLPLCVLLAAGSPTTAMQGHCPFARASALCRRPGHLQSWCLSGYLIHPTFALIGCRLATVAAQKLPDALRELAESTATG
ncbi:hypothetical protein SNOG_11654 [Parastagonospora nodorum SN15]|uniref:Uncharacterized protein n=1 Tax=Phaeosphaeria nodorum (strain SN15 / ATCC MYA-4574 / FGSC 10173) TaxID=321614 RepID=Q0U9B0_PHANO|nr:hypothetical protein SNOG_11654 [Parastagonospora nodorum SN15]EAT80698.1 hypothetical protein SNOG_11654 [Parastagonospora nodorum SN15]